MADRAVTLVEAGPDDGDRVADIHARSWQASYRGILPDAYLDGEADRERRDYWRTALAEGSYWLVLMAKVEGDVAGFIALRTGQDAGYDATIEHLHVLPHAKGRGIGRHLMAEAARRLAAAGGGAVCLWVFEANQAAIDFYERLGGATDAHGVDKFAGSDAPDRRIGWRDMAALAAACEGNPRQ